MTHPREGKPLDGEAKRGQSSPRDRLGARHMPAVASGAAGGQPWEMGTPARLPGALVWGLDIIPHAASAFLGCAVEAKASKMSWHLPFSWRL